MVRAPRRPRALGSRRRGRAVLVSAADGFCVEAADQFTADFTDGTDEIDRCQRSAELICVISVICGYLGRGLLPRVRVAASVGCKNSLEEDFSKTDASRTRRGTK